MSAQLNLVGIPNPFVATTVDPWSEDFLDVPSIQNHVSHKCKTLLHDVRRSGKTSSLLIHGNPGSGKTHIIARLYRELIREKQRIVLCRVCWEGVEADELWRHLRCAFVSDLIRPIEDRTTQLERVLLDRIPNLLDNKPNEPKGILDWIDANIFGSTPRTSTRQQLVAGYLKHFPKLSYELRSVLPLLFSEQAEDARNWLLGEMLPEQQLRKMGLSTNPLSDRDREKQAQSIVLSLLRIVGKSHPLLLCYDQMEGLQAHHDDKQRLRAFGDLFMTLYDFPEYYGLHLLFIQTIQRGFLQASVNDAVWRRLANYKEELYPLTWEESVHLIAQRMNSVPELRDLRSGQNQFWPLAKTDVVKLFNKIKISCTPHQLLIGCRDLFNPTPPAPLRLDEFLARKWEQRNSQRLNNPPERAFAGLTLGIPLLLRLTSSHYRTFESTELKEKLPDVGLIFTRPDGKLVGVSFCDVTQWDLRWRLDRLRKQWASGYLHQLILLRTSPEGTTKKNNEKLEALGAHKGLIVHQPTYVKVTALAALQSLEQDALNGKLFSDDGPVSAHELEAWAYRSLFEELHPLGVLKDFLDELGFENLSAS